MACLLAGCNDDPATKPPVTGKVPDWKSMTKEEKIENLRGNPSIPPAALQDAIRRVEQGID